MERNLDETFSSGTDATMFYVVPFIRWDRKKILDFYATWCRDNNINATFKIEAPIGNFPLWQRLLWRDLHIRVDANGMTYGQIYEAYRMLRQLEYIEPLRQSMM